MLTSFSRKQKFLLPPFEKLNQIIGKNKNDGRTNNQTDKEVNFWPQKPYIEHHHKNTDFQLMQAFGRNEVHYFINGLEDTEFSSNKTLVIPASLQTMKK